MKRSGSTARLFIMDVDRWGDESLNFILSLRQENSKITVVALTSNKKKWLETVSGFGAIEVTEKPLSVWSLHSLIGKLYRPEAQQPLLGQLELTREAESTTTSPANNLGRHDKGELQGDL